MLELMTEGRARLDQRLAALGPDVLGSEFEFDRAGGGEPDDLLV
ncbi:MAG: hypothetical protein ACYC91_05450 [Solirubrobacteraceae bacterium]